MARKHRVVYLIDFDFALVERETGILGGERGERESGEYHGPGLKLEVPNVLFHNMSEHSPLDPMRGHEFLFYCE